MKSKLFFLLLLTFLLFLCGCSDSVQKTEIETSQETAIPAVTVPETTESTAPLHSDRYLPEYTLEQITAYFEEVVLDIEYSDGTGNVQVVHKWMAPISYRVYGTPTEEDLAVLNSLFAELNRIPGFPGFYTAEVEGLENLSISFLEPDIFRDSYSAVVNGEDSYGATQFWYYTDSNEIYSARIGYRTDISQAERNSILVEEIINTLGISDTVQREDSITYQYSNTNTALSAVDWVLLKLLYHPDVQCGMDGEDCAVVIQGLYN